MSLVTEPSPDARNSCGASASTQRVGQALGLVSGIQQQPSQRDSAPESLAGPQPITSGIPARWRDPEKERGTYLYLAYGSNLCHEVFQERRRVKPLATANVVVPSLRLTFDLPGFPYIEPCFANTALRDPSQTIEADETSEKAPLLHTPDYHKDRWKKGLVGVVYECTKEDYIHIIATEGGGSAYKDILVECFVIPPGGEVPMNPTSEPIMVHTLFAPAPKPSSNDEAESGVKTTGRMHRPDPSYAQASERYLKYFIDGSNEHNLPEEYKEYLRGLRPYMITTTRQRCGQVLIVTTWAPMMLIIFGLQSAFQDKDGHNPPWLGKLQESIFLALWTTYDRAIKVFFGDGERTIGDSD